MAVLAECPYCHRKQALKNKLCKNCGADLDKLKRAHQKVKYWIQYRMPKPDGEQKKEYVGYSIEDAKTADGKRRTQKKENRIFEILPDGKMTFNELSEWYLKLNSVKNLSSYRRVKSAMDNFNNEFGESIVGDIRQEHLEEYQYKRKNDERADATVDYEISIVKTMINRAFDNDLVGARVLKAFRKTKKVLKPGSNARDRILTVEEYLGLVNAAAPHLKPILIVAYNTGMRRGEILGLEWDQVDLKKGFITLRAEDTKEKKAKKIPINKNVKDVLEGLKAVPIIREGKRVSNVFTFNKKPLSDNFRKSLVSACKEVNIPLGQNIEGGFRFHDIRTTVKTNMLRAGVDKALRDTILGHSLKGMDVYYIKPSDDDLHRVMNQYTQWLDEQIEALRTGQNFT